MAYKRISFVIVNYNTRDLLKKCVGNLMGVWPNMEIVVVDNASTDGSLEALSEYQSRKNLILIQTENKGISAANNLALEKCTGEYICYIGTDAYPIPDAIRRLFGFMEENTSVGISVPKLVLRDGSIDWDAHRGFPTPWASFSHFTRLNKLFPKSKLFNQYFLGWNDFTSPHEIDVCTSHFMFVRRDVHNHIQKWDEDYFIFGEDVDFCYRVKEFGYKIMYLPTIEVLHFKGAGVGRKTSSDLENASNTSKETKLRVAKATTHAMGLFYKKHLDEKHSWVLTSIVLLTIKLMTTLRVLKVHFTSGRSQ